MSRIMSAVLFPWRCSQCRSSRWHTKAIRTYASTAQSNDRRPPTQSDRTMSRSTLPRASQIQSHVSPTSPRYLPVPQSKQATYEPPSRIRGILPAPRNIFHRKRGGPGSRYTDEYFSKLTKTPLKPRATSVSEENITDPQAGRNAWRARMSDLRRKHLVEGIRELQVKRRETAISRQRASLARVTLRRKLRAEREARQDERLTASTIPASIRDPLQKSQISDPGRAERVAAMKARVEEKESLKRAERKDALHTLYMHARNFIITEEQLDAAIETAFGTQQRPKTWGNEGVSIWSKGNPESIADKLMKSSERGDSFRDSQGAAELTNRRMKRIAEALTGGKI